MALTISGPVRPYITSISDLRGGLNDSVKDEFIDDNQLSDVRNYMPDVENSGMLIKREGITKESTQVTNPVTSVYDGEDNDYFTTTTVVHQLDGTVLLSNLTSSLNYDWTSFSGRDYFTNGTELRFTSGGTVFSNWSGPPAGIKYIEAFNNFVFVAGHDGPKVRWSALGDATSFPAVNEWALNEIDLITGLAVFNDVLLVFSEKDIYHVTGFNEVGIYIPYRIRRIGTESNRSITVVPSVGAFWWSHKGPAFTTDGQNIRFPGDRKIPKLLSDLSQSNLSKIHSVWDEYNQRVQFFVISSGTTVNMRLDYYPLEDAFFVHEGDGVEMGASGSVTVSGRPTVFVGSAAASGYLYEQTGNTDDGETISAYVETKRESTESGPLSIKRTRFLVPRFIVPTAANSSVNYSVYIDDNIQTSKTFNVIALQGTGFLLGTDVLGTGILGGDVGVTVDRKIGYKLRWKKLKHRVDDSSDGRTRFIGVINEGYSLAL